MPSEALKEADRVMRICNACRYCQGFCAVFPAMELRRVCSGQDLKYLANLCHDCRGCYYAYQYAPPHEFALNLPKALGDLRLETYREFSWPPILKNLFNHSLRLTAIAAMLGFFIIMLLVLLFQGQAVFFNNPIGEGSFYRVVPYAVMSALFISLGIFVLCCLGGGTVNYFRGTGVNIKDLLDPRGNLQAISDVLQMKNLGGAGYGCNYPDERFSMIRRYLHHVVFYGFMLCLASTITAFIAHHFLNRPAPYPFWSWPVTLGTLGGLAILSGTVGLIFLKTRTDKVAASIGSYGLDISFLLLLFLISFTGLLLLLFRSTPAMGILLAVHIGLVAGLFLTMPYGKFVHALYRYAALVCNAVEQSGAKH
jgi:citrate/tricarballylate utilization protein